MKTCFFHIGHAKTATTSLQTFMHANEDLFAAKGIWVPGDYRAFGASDCGAMARAGKVIAGNFGAIFTAHAAKNTQLTETLLAHVFSRDTDVLLSTELIFYYKHMVRDVLAAANARGYAVTLIAYLRRQDRMVVPTFYQNVRNHGYFRDVPAFLTDTAQVRYFRYHEVMGVYGVTAPNRLIVRTFEPEFLRGGDIIEDFTALLGVELPVQAATSRERINPSLSLETLEVLRALNALGRADLVRQVLAQPNAAPPGSSRRAWQYYYDDTVAAAMAEHFMGDNARLVADYLRDRSGAEQSYWLQPPDRPEPSPRLDANGLAVALAAILPPPTAGAPRPGPP